MAEFSIIDQFCTNIGANHSATDIGVGDDAAVISIPADKRLAISVDTMVADVHFYADAQASTVAHKLLTVNLSDMAAMGAEPKWATMTLTAPSLDTHWLSQFSSSLDRLAKHYGVQLIGGDTTQGQLNLSLQIMGLVPKSKALTRSGAKIGDDVYVSNCIGDAALALRCLALTRIKNKTLTTEQSKLAALLTPQLLAHLEQPTPQIKLGLALVDLAHSCIDVSDGLLADLSHIAKKSNVSIHIDVDALPLSKRYQNYMALGGDVDLALTGGDDYQLAFSAPSQLREKIDSIANQLNVPVSRIGQVVEKGSDEQLIHLFNNGHPYFVNQSTGYQHFKD